MKPKFLDCPPRYMRNKATSVDSAYAAFGRRVTRRPFDWQDLVVMAACLVAVVALLALGYFK